MPKKCKKILTPNKVHELGLDEISVITADMLDGYTSIGVHAFLCCSGLTSITIPNSVTSIGTNAFLGCSGLTSITIPNSVTSIGSSAFCHCRSLTSITIPNSVINIGCWAFWDCRSLTSITIPNSLVSIGDCAFYGCSHLTSVTIGDKTHKQQTVTNGKCKAYKGFNTDMTCRGFQYEEGKTYEFEGEPKLCSCGFHACLSLTDVFNYYKGKIGRKFVVYEVELEGVSDEKSHNSKVVAKKITIGKRIL